MTRYKRAADAKAAIAGGEYVALAEFRYQIRLFLRFSEEASRAAGMEPQQHQLLLVLKRLAVLGLRPTISVLAERLQIQHHSAVELVDRSVKRGLARRARPHDDRRQVLVELTLKGERLLRDLTLHHRNALGMAAPALVEALNTLVPAAAGGARLKTAAGNVARRRTPEKGKPAPD